MDFSKTIAGGIDKLLDFAFRSIWATVFVFALSSTLMFLPVSFLESIGVQGLASRYEEWIGLAWLVSGIILLIFLIRTLGRLLGLAIKKIRLMVARDEAIKRRADNINNLNNNQVDILIQFFQNHTDHILLPHRMEDVRDLESKGFIRAKFPTQQAETLYILEPWVTEAVMREVVEKRNRRASGEAD